MSVTADTWTADDIGAVRDHIPDADDRDIAKLLDTYRERKLSNPVAYARSIAKDGRLARELAGIAKARKKAEAARTIEEQKKTGPECEHGMPGGSALHPETGLPLCPICRKAAAAAPMPAEPGTAPAAAQPVTDAGDSEASAIFATWTSAASLMQQTFTATRWAVKDLVPQGVMFLAGAPKVGKSWLALDMAVSVASGEKFLDKLTVDQGPVLYLALEDTSRRLQNRLGKILNGKPAPDALTLATQCPPISAGGLELIRQWLSGHQDARLIIIDVWAKIRGPVTSSGSVYAADYAAVTAIKKLADQHDVAIVLIHHLRKMADDDYLNELSGTLGLPAAADTIAGLKRERGDFDATLSITGRDVEESKLAMKFDKDRCLWTIIGAARDHELNDTRRAILTYITANDGSTPKQIADGTGLDRQLVKKTVLRMAADDQLDRDSTRGRYFVPSPIAISVPAVPRA
jgi:hypothetical protein